jgi:hypothetical protein
MENNNQALSAEQFKKNAFQEAERMKNSLQEKGVDEKTINETIAAFMKSIEETIKNQDNERN